MDVTRTAQVDDICINTLEDARRYRAQIESRQPEKDPVLAGWQVCKRCILVAVLAAAAFMYYIITVNIEVLSLPALQVAVTTSK